MDKNKELQRQQEDAAFAHGLWWVGGAIVLEALLMLFKNTRYNYTGDTASLTAATLASQILKVLLVAGPALIIIAFVLAFLSFKKTGTIGYKLEALLGASSMLTLATYMCQIYGVEGATVMLLFIPAVGAVAFSFFLYPHDFFYVAAFSGMTALVQWMIWHQTESNMPVALIGSAKVVVFGALIAWLCTLLKKSEGTVNLMGRTVRILPQDAVYPVIFATVAICALSVVIALVLGAQIALYLMYAMAAWVFAMMVYYTVRML